MKEVCNNHEVCKDTTLTAAVLAAHYLNKAAYMSDYQLVIDTAQDFCRLFSQFRIKDWSTYIDENKHKDVKGKDIKPTDWEDFVVMYCKPLLLNLKK